MNERKTMMTIRGDFSVSFGGPSTTGHLREVLAALGDVPDHSRVSLDVEEQHDPHALVSTVHVSVLGFDVRTPSPDPTV